jgi:diaminopimelate decarboxylase
MQVRELIDQTFPGSGGKLHIGGIDVETIAEEFGTPLFIYDESVLLRKWQLLRSTYPSRFDIHYSVKANPNLNLLIFFLAQGAGLEIASAGELHLALEAGCNPDRILFAGPGKTQAEIELALKAGVGEIHAESLIELERIAFIAARLNQVAHVAIRVNPDSDAQGGAMRMGGKATPFGIDEEKLPDALNYALSFRSIAITGIHLFSGTQLLDADIILAQYRKGLQIAQRASQRLGQPLRSVDFGGGLGVPYFANEHALDMARLKQGLADLVSELDSDPAFKGTRFIVEPGRYLTAEAGVYLARVLDLKVSRGKNFAVVDGGMNHHLAASGNLGQTIKRNFPVAVANRLLEPEGDPVDIVGPLCTPLDVLARSLPAPKMQIGDLVAVLQSGAYARSASPMGFLSHAAPPEVLVADGEARLIRRRGSVCDYHRDVEMVFPASAKEQRRCG